MNSKYITVEVTDDTFRALAQAGSSQGIHLQTFAGLMILRGLKDFAAGNIDPQLQLFLLAQTLFDQNENRRAVTAIMKYLLEHPDEQKMNQLIELCDTLAIDIQDIERTAAQDIKNPIGLMSIRSRVSKVDIARQWLEEHMQPMMDYRAADMIAAAAKEGIRESHLGEARKALRIKSYRASEGFYWTIPVHAVEMAENGRS